MWKTNFRPMKKARLYCSFDAVHEAGVGASVPVFLSFHRSRKAGGFRLQSRAAEIRQVNRNGSTNLATCMYFSPPPHPPCILWGGGAAYQKPNKEQNDAAGGLFFALPYNTTSGETAWQHCKKKGTPLFCYC